MEKIVRDDIINIIDKAIKAIEKEEFYKLLEISNHTIHNASIFQDENSITIAVVIWSLSKIIKNKGSVENELLYELREAKEMLEKADENAFCDKIKNITNKIKKIDSKMRFYIQEVLNRAQIKKGSKLYDHGISMARAAELLGLSQWELMNYIGKTNIQSDSTKIRSGLEQRFRLTRKLFSITKR